MRNIIFTIKTSYSEEHYFLVVNENHTIEMQLDVALSEICFCDAYEIISCRETDVKYVEERNALMTEYEKKYGETVEDSFCSGKYTTLEAIKDDMKWRDSLCSIKDCSCMLRK